MDFLTQLVFERIYNLNAVAVLWQQVGFLRRSLFVFVAQILPVSLATLSNKDAGGRNIMRFMGVGSWLDTIIRRPQTKVRRQGLGVEMLMSKNQG